MKGGREFANARPARTENHHPSADTQAARSSGRFIRDIAGADAEDAAWKVDLLFSIAARSWIVHLLIIGLTTGVLWNAGRSWWVGAWCVILVFAALGQLLLSHAYRRRPRDAATAQRFARWHGLLMALVGLTWGAGALLTSGDDELLLFYTLMMGGTALGAVGSQHMRLKSCMLSIWTSIPLLAAAQLLQGLAPRNLAAAAAVLLYGLLLTIMAQRLHGFLVENRRVNALLQRRNRQLTEMAEELREAQQAKMRFIAQASHDLRQPIHAIGLFVECLKDARLSAEEREVLGRVDKSLEGLARLCGSLLDISALDVGEIRPTHTIFALMDVLGDVRRQAEEQARRRGVELRVVKTRAWVRSDPVMLHNMLQNLVSNALKYAPDGKVLLGVRRVNGRLAVDVLDQGPGLTQEEQRRIFGEFVRLKREGEEQPEGFGLGLSIVQRMARLLELELLVRSRPGHGTCFRIAGLQPAVPQKAQVRSRQHATRLDGMRVIIVDDDANVRESTARMLRGWGCKVMAVSSFPDESLLREADFVLCDQQLGEHSGLELLLNRRQRLKRDIPAAIVTADNHARLRDEAGAAGIPVLHKPVRPVQLRSLLLTAQSR